MARAQPARRVAAARPPAAAARRSAAPARRRSPSFTLAGFGRRPLAALEARGRTIRDPVEKLRFLRYSLERFETLDERLQVLPGAPLRWAAYRLTGVEDVRPLFSKNPYGALDPPRRSRPPLPRRARRTVNAAALLLMAAAGLALAGYPLGRSVDVAPPATALATPRPAPTAAVNLAPARGGVTPERIWLVEQGAAFEQYSNGLRIDTTFAVTRRAAPLPRLRRRTGGMAPARPDRPVGILFHTSESDVWPLEESFNENLRDTQPGPAALRAAQPGSTTT